jgi:hypothetical protein
MRSWSRSKSGGSVRTASLSGSSGIGETGRSSGSSVSILTEITEYSVGVTSVDESSSDEIVIAESSSSEDSGLVTGSDDVL